MSKDELRVRVVLRDPPDIKALARAYLRVALQMEQKRRQQETQAKPVTSPNDSVLVK